MKNLTLLAAAAILLVSNAIALVHAARNRAGAPDAEITLTQREAVYSPPNSSDDDSGVTLSLRWVDPGRNLWGGDRPVWLDRKRLEQLGFDCSADPTTDAGRRSYQRQRARRAFVALEYDGPAWREWMETSQVNRFGNPAPGEFLGRLVAVDADLNAVRFAPAIRVARP